MATERSYMTDWRRGDWPAAMVMAVIGGVFGMVAALLALAGIGAGTMVAETTPMVAGMDVATVLGGVAVVNVILAILVFVSAGLMGGNMRLHGGLLILWGVLGLFFAFGLWFGAVLVIVGGALAFLQSGPRAPMTRGPVA